MSKDKSDKSDTVKLAELASDTTKYVMWTQNWLEHDRINSNKETELIKLNYMKEIEIKNLEERAFQFKVNGFVEKDNCKFEDAMSKAYQTTQRENTLKMLEEYHKKNVEKFEEEKSMIKPKFFFYGFATSTLIHFMWSKYSNSNL